MQFALLHPIIKRLASDAQIMIDLSRRQQILASIEFHVGLVEQLPQVAAMEVQGTLYPSPRPLLKSTR